MNPVQICSSFLLSFITLNAQPKGFLYDESRVSNYELPDPLICLDGTKVVNSKLWLNKKNTGRIIFTPHVAFYSQEALFEIRYKGVNTLKKYFQKKVTKNCINLQLIK